MNASDPAGSASNPGRAPISARRRFWRWGIGFWLILWIVAILVEVGLTVRMKDRPRMMLGVGYGSLVVALNDQEVGKVNGIGRHGPFFIWSGHNLHLHSEHPEFLFARLGSVMWKTSVDRHTVALPVSGFLWLWLIGGWVAAFRKNQRLDLSSRRILVAALILLPVVIIQATRTMNKVMAENETAGCMMNMRNIQCAVRSYWGMRNLISGDLIPWDEIFGPDNFISDSSRTCPSGQDYILDARIPAEYRLVVKCPNPGHQRRLKEIDTSGW